jgi:hypothetical protein
MKRLLLATSILALAAGGAFAQGVGSTPPDTPRTLAPSSPSTSAPSGARTMSATPSTSSSVSSTTNAAPASPDQVVEAQQALKQQGLYKGPVDGKIGPETRTAISRFQKQNGLQQSAQLDERTMDDLQGNRSGVGGSTRMPSNSSMPGVSGDRLSSPGVGSSGADKDDDTDKR